MENEDRIAAYLNNEMTDAEMEAFVKDLEQDEALRQAFQSELEFWLADQEIENQEEKKHAVIDGFESADAHIEFIKQSLEGREEVRIIPFYTKYKLALSVAAMLIIIVIVYLLFNQPSTPGKQIAVDQKQDSVITDSPNIPNENPIANIQDSIISKPKTADALYAAYFKRYKQRDEHGGSEIGFLSYYTDKKYSTVLNANPSDFIVRSGGSFKIEDSLTVLYIRFYQALCFLETDKAAAAIAIFKLINLSTIVNNSLRDDANWYLALAYLKQKNTNAAGSVLKQIAENKNALHYSAAKELLSELK